VILELFKNLSISKFEIYVLVDTGYIFVGLAGAYRIASWMRNQLTVPDSTLVINSDLMKAEGAWRKITQSRSVENPGVGSWISRGIRERQGGMAKTTLRALIAVSLHIIGTYSRERRNCRIARTKKEEKACSQEKDANSGKPHIIAVAEFTCLASRISSLRDKCGRKCTRLVLKISITWIKRLDSFIAVMHLTHKLSFF